MNPAPDNDQLLDESTHTISWVSYILHLIVAVGAVIPGTQPGVALLIVALIIDLVKKGEADGTWQASHFSWRIRTVIWAAILYLVTAPLWLAFLVPGMMAWIAISIWFLYRIVRGMVAMNANQTLPR